MNPVTCARQTEAALWYCADCFRSGVLLLNGASPYDVVEALMSAHADAQRLGEARCDSTIGTVRLIKPESWYASINNSRRGSARPLDGGRASNAGGER